MNTSKVIILQNYFYDWLINKYLRSIDKLHTNPQTCEFTDSGESLFRNFINMNRAGSKLFLKEHIFLRIKTFSTNNSS